jgi:spermidine synthase
LLVGAPEPASAQANRYYTREFFEQCARALAPGGVAGLRLHTSENYWTATQRERITAIHRAVAPVFQQVRLVPTPTMLLMIAGSGLATDAESLVERFVARQLVPRLATPEFLRYVYEGDRRGEAERLVRRGTTPPNTDAMPAAFRLALIGWLGRFWPGLANTGLATLDRARLPRAWLAVTAAVLVAVLAVLRRWRARHLAFVAVIGLIGMLLESVVILHYQVARGVLFADVGLLLTAFMAGLSAGAAVAHRCAATWTRRRAALIGATLALACGAIGAWVASGAAPNLPASCAALLAAGGFTGALFGWASVDAPERVRQRAATLYAADVLGGCCGAVLGGLVLIPFAGLPGTAFVAAALALAAVLLA